VLSLFTITNNFITQVIYDKDERGHLAQTEGFDNPTIEYTLDRIGDAPELTTLNRDEVTRVLVKIIEFHARAFDWQPDVNAEELCEIAWRGHLLRTKIRTAIEYLDQLFQYGDTAVITTGELDQETFNEEIPLPDEW
jgi:hypothetical protein